MAATGLCESGRMSVSGGLKTLTLLYYTYILRSLKDNGYYFGHSSSLELRLEKHNKGSVKSTKGRIPFVIHYWETFETRAEAYRREIFFKSLEGRKWLFEKNIISPR
jgi:putative endonuclease